jgi:hypothetical protein
MEQEDCRRDSSDLCRRLFITGTKSFLARSTSIGERFIARSCVQNKFTHAGLNISRNESSSVILLEQINYGEKLQILSDSAGWTEYRSSRAKLQWLLYTRPDICGSVAFIACVIEEGFNRDLKQHQQEINRIIRQVQRNPVRLAYRTLDLDTARIVAYSDANYDPNSCQLGHVVILENVHGVAHILDYQSKKSQRIVTSVFSGEGIALAEAFDRAFILQYDLELLLGRKLPVHLQTDFLALFDSVTKTPYQESTDSSSTCFNFARVRDAVKLRRSHLCFRNGI